MTPEQQTQIAIVLVLGAFAGTWLVAGILCLMYNSSRKYSGVLLLASLLCCVGIVYILQP